MMVGSADEQRSATGLRKRLQPSVNPTYAPLPTGVVSDTVQASTVSDAPTAAATTQAPGGLFGSLKDRTLKTQGLRVFTSDQALNYDFVLNTLAMVGGGKNEADIIWKLPGNYFTFVQPMSANNGEVWLTPEAKAAGGGDSESNLLIWARNAIKAIDQHNAEVKKAADNQAAKDAADKAAKDAADAAAAAAKAGALTPLPGLPLPGSPPTKTATLQPRPPTTSPMNSAIVALGAAGAIYVISKLV